MTKQKLFHIVLGIVTIVLGIYCFSNIISVLEERKIRKKIIRNQENQDALNHYFDDMFEDEEDID